MKGMSLHWKIIIGMIFGIIFGLLANNFGLVLFTQNWIKPFGVIFVNLFLKIHVSTFLYLTFNEIQKNEVIS